MGMHSQLEPLSSKRNSWDKSWHPGCRGNYWDATLAIHQLGGFVTATSGWYHQIRLSNNDLLFSGEEELCQGAPRFS